MQYYGVLVALDTNILISNIQTIRSLAFLIEDINIGLFIPRTVIRELDAIKTVKPNARAAISFIEQENARINRKIFVEPSVSEKGAINDDSIILSCRNNGILLLLSDDTALRIKASNSGYNLVAISVQKKTAQEILQEITDFFGIEFMDYDMKDDTVGTMKKLTAQVASAIYYEKVYPIAKRELGEEMVFIYLPSDLNLSLSSLLKYVSKNAHLFSSILSRSSIKMLSRFANEKVTVEDLQTILDIFGVSSFDFAL